MIPQRTSKGEMQLCNFAQVRRFGWATLDPCVMKYTIYEDPHTHKFALIELPPRFLEGDDLPLAEVNHWFGSRDEAIAALPDLLDREEPDSATAKTTQPRRPN